jgi:hypothetical protein
VRKRETDIKKNINRTHQVLKRPKKGYIVT